MYNMLIVILISLRASRLSYTERNAYQAKGRGNSPREAEGCEEKTEGKNRDVLFAHNAEAIWEFVPQALKQANSDPQEALPLTTY